MRVFGVGAPSVLAGIWLPCSPLERVQASSARAAPVSHRVAYEYWFGAGHGGQGRGARGKWGAPGGEAGWCWGCGVWGGLVCVGVGAPYRYDPSRFC